MGSSIIHTSDVAGVEKKLTPISQFEMVEGMIADCLCQCCQFFIITSDFPGFEYFYSFLFIKIFKLC